MGRARWVAGILDGKGGLSTREQRREPAACASGWCGSLTCRFPCQKEKKRKEKREKGPRSVQSTWDMQSQAGKNWLRDVSKGFPWLVRSLLRLFLLATFFRKTGVERHLSYQNFQCPEIYWMLGISGHRRCISWTVEHTTFYFYLAKNNAYSITLHRVCRASQPFLSILYSVFCIG